jgi:hypothetical protein
METYRLQYASDLHLETTYIEFDSILKPVGQDLALCGDIGDPFSVRYSEFLKWVSVRWQRVFVLAGNHEYFTTNKDIVISDVDAQIDKVCRRAGNNVFFLQKNLFKIESLKIVIIGATLWSIPDLRRWSLLNDGFLGDPGYRGDYTEIYLKDEYSGKSRPVHPSDITQLCTDHTAFLSRALNPTWGSIPDGWRAIVLTHHMPTFLLNDEKYKDYILKSCYAVSLDHLIKEPVVLWLCGHNHLAKSIRMDSGCLLGLNPLGYKSQHGQTGYSSSAVANVYRENIAILRQD